MYKVDSQLYNYRALKKPINFDTLLAAATIN